MQQQQIQRKFLSSLSSEDTRKSYRRNIRYFCKFINIEQDNYDVLLDYLQSKEKKELENILIDYILYMKEERKLAPYTVNGYLNPIRHFLKMNDLTNINWHKVNKFQGKKHGITRDRPYTREEISKLLEAGTLRDRIIVLLMASAGLRIGALHSIKLGDLKPINKYNLYQITVYAGTESEYISFVTPECRKYIDEYLQLRQRYGENLTKNSPLIRTQFDISEPNSAGFKKNVEIRYGGVRNVITILLIRSGLRTHEEESKGKRTEIMADHGFRKFFSSTLETEGVNPVYIEVLMNHDQGLKTVYSRPTPTQLLEGNGERVLGYLAGINALTINDEQRLRKQVRQMKAEASSVTALSERLSSLEAVIKNVLVNNDTKDRSTLTRELVRKRIFKPLK